jgi:hypothetical protein
MGLEEFITVKIGRDAGLLVAGFCLAAARRCARLVQLLVAVPQRPVVRASVASLATPVFTIGYSDFGLGKVLA